MEFNFNWIGGATFIVSIADIKIAVDPVLCKKGTVQNYFWFKSMRIEEPVYEKSDFENIDLWLITHNHLDHLDSEGLEVITDNAKIITNYNASTVLYKSGKTNVTVLKWHQKSVFICKGYTITIQAIPAIHGINPLSAFFAGKVNGYFVTINKDNQELSIYITSDTVYKKVVLKPIVSKKIDVLIPNMGAAKKGTWIMTLTLDSAMLEKLISKINPLIVIPVHYGTFAHYYETSEAIKALNNPRILMVKVGSKTALKV